MASFPNIAPSNGAQKSVQPTVHTVKFGDGYQQRVLVGLPSNQNPKTWNLTFEVSETDADTIENFLEARLQDVASFDWTPPDSSTSYKWTCFNWSKTIPYYGRATITATFNQVFEP